MKEAIRLVYLTTALGIAMSPATTIDLQSSEFNSEQENGEFKSLYSRKLKTDKISDGADLDNLTVVQLKEILKERGLKISGTKSELIERLTNQ